MRRRVLRRVQLSQVIIHGVVMAVRVVHQDLRHQLLRSGHLVGVQRRFTINFEGAPRVTLRVVVGLEKGKVLEAVVMEAVDEGVGYLHLREKWKGGVNQRF